MVVYIVFQTDEFEEKINMAPSAIFTSRELAKKYIGNKKWQLSNSKWCIESWVVHDEEVW